MPTLEELEKRVIELEKLFLNAININELPLLDKPERKSDYIEVYSDSTDHSYRVSLNLLLNHETTSITSTQSIEQYKIVDMTLALADNQYPDTVDKLLGVTLNNGSGNIEVLMFGIIHNVNWNWLTTQPLFLGENGNFTQNEPSNGISWILAKPIENNLIFFKPKTPIIKL